ncbi:MAG: hypothetical protein IK095_00105 [Oscillospiraceae bacterium]|nr:hypothetical protein [Oscillospiraceae bacterium]
MKKTLSILLLSCLLLVLCACGSQTDAAAPDGSTPETDATAPGTPTADTRSIVLVNASVNGEDHMVLTEEGHFLARAVLPDRSRAVDHWTINGADVDAEGRRYSLEFDSAGTDVVSAVLRERLHVSCDGCYLQFLDDNGTPCGPMYQKVYFEDNYVVPVTNNEHTGGSISCHIAAKVPAGMKVDYWVINGTALRYDQNVLGFTLVGLTKTLEIQVVLTSGNGTAGADVIMKFETDTGFSPGYPDDEPVILDDTDDGGFGWVLDDDGTPTTTSTTTGGGENGTGLESGDHTHDWVFAPELSYAATCTQDGRNTFRCSICGETYYQSIPGGHQYVWVDADTFYGHQQVCQICGAIGARESHNFAYEGNGWWRCTVCGYKWQEIN